MRRHNHTCTHIQTHTTQIHITNHINTYSDTLHSHGCTHRNTPHHTHTHTYRFQSHRYALQIQAHTPFTCMNAHSQTHKYTFVHNTRTRLHILPGHVIILLHTHIPNTHRCLRSEQPVPEASILGLSPREADERQSQQRMSIHQGGQGK